MSTISAFRGLHFNAKKIADVADVITPPYDAINAEDIPKYLTRSPYNIGHIILPQKPEEDYTRADEVFRKWRELDLVVEDTTPCYYLYRQNFEIDGARHTRDTLMAAVLLHDFSEGIIRPHENTFGKYKADRLQILRKTHCNLSHIFGMVKDSDGVLESAYEKWEFQTPLLRGTGDDGTEHVVWRIEAAKAQEITDFFKTQPIYIVDGHHRYESSLMYARETGAVGDPKNPAAYMMFAIANVYDPGLIVFPTHRIVSKGASDAVTRSQIEKDFTLSPMTFDELKVFVKGKTTGPSFAIALKGDLFHCTPKHWQAAESEMGRSLAKLAVKWSDHVLLAKFCGVDEANRGTRVRYEKDVNAAWAKRTESEIVIFHAPPAVESVTDVADEKHFMPQKSTYFVPKLAAGLIMRDTRSPLV